jgi:hypothetical protein
MCLQKGGTVSLTTWRDELSESVSYWEDKLEYCTLNEKELDMRFDPSFGGSEGRPFTAWGEKRIYFPAVYDGSEWVASVPRYVCEEATHHVGGE